MVIIHCIEAVAEASLHAGVKPPKFDIRRLKSGGYAVYSPFMHKIFLSVEVANKISKNHLRTLIAHEVGHATQRNEILMDALRYLLPAPLAFMVFGLLSIWAISAGFSLMALCVFLTGLCLFLIVDRFTSPQWYEAVDRRELQANLFANTFIGSSTAIECAIEACETVSV